jgi:stage IV sporulation protein B
LLDAKRRKGLISALVIASVSLLLLYSTGAVFSIPSHISILKGNSHFLDFASPLQFSVHSDKEDLLKINDVFVSQDGFRLDAVGPFRMESVGIGEINLEFRLFGLIPVKRVTVDVLPYLEVIPGGEAIGVLLVPEGVMVIGFETLTSSGYQRVSPAREKGIEVGDIVLSINGQQVYDRVYFDILLSRIGSTGKDVELKIKRGEHVFTTRIKPVSVRTIRGQGSPVIEYSVGLSVSDNAAGVGTLTFYHPESKRYGALGHVITEPKTRQALSITDGRIVNASISAIHQGQKGQPGEKIGTFQGSSDMIGSIDTNTDLGIYGELNILPPNMKTRKAIPVAMQDGNTL